MLRRILVAGISVLTFAICVFGQNTTKTVALRCGSLFDGRGDALRKNVVLVIEGEKIKEIAANAPADAEVVDLSHETCLPGLADTHTHIFLQGEVPAEGGYDVQLLKQSLSFRAARAVVSVHRALEQGTSSDPTLGCVHWS